MAPDVEYFLRLRTYGDLSHTWLGVFVFCLPVTMVVWGLYEYVVKRPLIQHLPQPFDRGYAWVLQERFSWHWRALVGWLVSAIIGIYSHIIWDGFTHSNGLFVRLFTLLQQPVSGLEMYHWLQYGSSLIGLTLVTFVFLRFGRKGGGASFIGMNRKFYFWLSWTVLNALFYLSFNYCYPDLAKWIGSQIVFVIDSVMLSLFVTCLVWRKK